MKFTLSSIIYSQWQPIFMSHWYQGKLKKMAKGSLLLATLSILLSGNAFGLSSGIFELEENKESIKTYYSKHIDNLRRAVQPRMINYVDTANYSRYGRLEVTGILFTYKDAHARMVQFVSDIDRFKPHAMMKNRRGVWYYLLIPEKYVSSKPVKKIRYKFMVDGIFEYDPTHNQFEEDRGNSFISTYYLTDDDISPHTGALILKDRPPYGRTVLFRIKAPEAARASVIGTFNRWDSSMDIMTRTEDGYFVLKKTLPPGEYIYLYRIDGETTLDKSNPDKKSHAVYGATSYLTIPES